jgi:hypothetical protein
MTAITNATTTITTVASIRNFIVFASFEVAEAKPLGTTT